MDDFQLDLRPQKEATTRSWDAPFVGDFAKKLLGTLHHRTETIKTEPSLYAPVVCHVQSSGTGKSRVHDELAKTVFYIPLNLSSSSSSFPPYDYEVVSYFKDSSYYSKQPFARDRCHAFVQALLLSTLYRLREICGEQTIADEIKTKPEARLSILASEFRKRMAEGRRFEEHGDYRRNFQNEVVAHAERIMEITYPATASQSIGSSVARDLVKPRPFCKDDLLAITRIAKELINLLDPEKIQSGPHMVICWDESTSLHSQQNGLWTLFSELAHTLRKLHEPSIISVFLSTAIPEVPHNVHALCPITASGFDQFAEEVDCVGEAWSLARIASTHQMVHLGRALFPTRFDHGNKEIKDWIIAFAVDKLLCGNSITTRRPLEPDQSLACLAMRLGLEFRATSWVYGETERRQVERHMRICVDATEGFQNIVTISPSEPLMAEASWQIMCQKLDEERAPRALLEHIDNSYLDAGKRGEVVAALLLLLACDEARQVQSDKRYKHPKVDFKCDGFAKGRIITVPEFIDALVPPDSRSHVREQKPYCCSSDYEPKTTLASAFAKAHIYFNHFVRVYDLEHINRQYLWHFICRGAAIICANSQREVHIVIPVLMGTILRPGLVTAILVQVKSDSTFTHTVFKPLFAAMDPFFVGLFSEDDAKAGVPPILRVVLALGSQKSAVKGPKPRSPGKSPFTAYDLWIAGVSTQSFGVIPDYTDSVYRNLLSRTGNNFHRCNYNRYKGNPKLSELINKIECAMQPGVASGDAHFENYIVNLDDVPLADYNDDDFVEPMDGDSEDADMREADATGDGDSEDVDDTGDEDSEDVDDTSDEDSEDVTRH